MIFLFLIVIFSYLLMHFIEMTSFGSRVAGRIVNCLALGTTLQQSIYTASRFLLIPFLPIMGYLVESGIDLEQYLLLVVASLFASLLVSFFVLFKLNFFQHFFQRVFNEYSNNNIPTALFKSLVTKNKSDFHTKSCANFSLSDIIVKKTFVSFFAYFFLVTGFFIAFLLAILYPENRLTLSQFTATFHGIGAVVLAFYLDPMLSRSMDKHSNHDLWLRNVYSILLGRALSYLAAVILCLLAFLYIYSK